MYKLSYPDLVLILIPGCLNTSRIIDLGINIIMCKRSDRFSGKEWQVARVAGKYYIMSALSAVRHWPNKSWVITVSKFCVFFLVYAKFFYGQRRLSLRMNQPAKHNYQLEPTRLCQPTPYQPFYILWHNLFLFDILVIV